MSAAQKMHAPATGERPIPKHIRRSVLCMSIEDPQLAQKAYDSWADAIVLDTIKASGRDWQQDLRSQMPGAIHAASRGGAEVFVRIRRDTAIAELDSVVFSGMAGVVLRGVNAAD